VLDEQIQKANFIGPELRQLAYDIIGDQVAAARSWGEVDVLLKPGHLRRTSSGGGRGSRGEKMEG